MKTTGERKMSFNKITLVGNLGRDPELRYTPQGTPVCSFSLATNERRKDRATGENNDITTWFRVTLWGRQAETASQYLTRGRPVYIEGRLRQPLTKNRIKKTSGLIMRVLRSSGRFSNYLIDNTFAFQIRRRKSQFLCGARSLARILPQNGCATFR